MDRDLSNFVPQNGMDVLGADGEKVGEIDAVEHDYFVVRKGFFFPQDHYIPMTAISSYDEDGKVYLNVTKDEALEQEWGTRPADMLAADYGQDDLTTVDKDQVFEERTIEVPVSVEEVDIRKDAREDAGRESGSVSKIEWYQGPPTKEDPDVDVIEEAAKRDNQTQ